MKTVLGSSYTHDLLQLMFTLPYLRIELLESKHMAHRQTASTWLKKLASANMLIPHKMSRTIYFVNYKLMEILSGD